MGTREHTSILEAEDRRTLETRFISGGRDWDQNVISATPTLEMGINIGDLSSLLLCSIPPEQVNYIQRIGRTGRRDGNSLNLTIVNARLLYTSNRSGAERARPDHIADGELNIHFARSGSEG